MNSSTSNEFGRRDAWAAPVSIYRDLTRRAWQVAGDRAIEALNGLLTNDVLGPEPGSLIPCLALTPRGRPLADLQVWKRSPSDGPLLLDLPESGAEALREHLGRYLPPRFARVEPLEGAALVRVFGPKATALLADLLGEDFQPPPADHFIELDFHSRRVLIAGRPESVGGGWEILATDAADQLESALVESAESVGGSALSGATWESIRIERGLPRYGVDYGLNNLPQETGLTDRMVSFDKGCYTGQEVVARIHYRGHVNRRLTGLARNGETPIPVGTELFDGDRQVGHVTSTATSPEFGSIALGMVRRDVDPCTKLSTSAGARREIEVRSLPFTLT